MSETRVETLLDERFVKETGAAAVIAELAEPVLQGLGFRLVLVRLLASQGTVLEIMAERPDGSMTIADCRQVSLALSPVLDVHDPLPGSYRLQISSPGIDRPLVRASDFDQWAGFEARIELKQMIDGRRRFRGILEGFEDGEVRIEVDLGKEQGQAVLGLPIAMIDEAKLVLTDELVRESLRRAKHVLAELEADDVEIEIEDGASVGTEDGEENAGTKSASPSSAVKARGAGYRGKQDAGGKSVRQRPPQGKKSKARGRGRDTSSGEAQ